MPLNAKRALETEQDANLELIADLRQALAAMQDGTPSLRDFMGGLLKLAREGGSIPYHRGGPALKPLARKMGLHFHRAYLPVGKQQLALLAKWGPRFPREFASTSYHLRAKLPGVKETGVDVPTKTLIRAMKEEAAKMRPSDRLTLLNHMIKIAEGTRTLPHWRAKPNMTVLRSAAGLTRSHVTGASAAAEMKQKWAGFFHLSNDNSFSHGGKIRSRSTGVAEVETYLADLRKRKNPLQYRSRSRPTLPSFTAAAEATGLPRRLFIHGEARDLLIADANARGLRGIWRYRSNATDEAMKARREELLPYIEDCAARGIPLVAKRAHRKSIDHEELAERAGLPGLSLEGDQKFLTMVRKSGVAVVPWTPKTVDDIDYNHLIEAAPIARSVHLPINSRASTKSRTRSAIELFQNYTASQNNLAQGENRLVDDDFRQTPAEFEQLLDEMSENEACGATPSTFFTAIRWVRGWLISQRESDGLGSDFSTVIRIAVSRTSKRIIDIAAEAGVTKGCLAQWVRGDSWPAGENVDRIPALESALGIPPGRLSKLLFAPGSGTAGLLEKKKLPERMKPHVPDDWRQMTTDEFEELKEYIDSWLLHRATQSGATSRAAARKRVAEEFRQRELGIELVGIGASLQAELSELVEHMTKEFGTALLRRPGKSWDAKSTAVKNTSRLVDFAKWQTRPISEGGLGRNPDHLTLVDLFHPPLVFSYIDHKARAHEDVLWKGVKRGKLFTSTESDFLVLSATLLARDYGWITQKPNLAKRIIPDTRMLPTFSYIDATGVEIDDDEEEDAPVDGGAPIMPRSLVGLSSSKFLAQVRSAELRYRQAAADLDLLVEGARDPMEPIQPIIDHPQPLLVLLTHLYAAAEREPNRTRSELAFHLHKRDTLINRLFALTALRSTNVREIRVDGPTPNLVWDRFKKQWLLQIHWRNFKNFRSAPLFGRKRHREWYRKYLPNENGLSELIEQYLKDSRPWFLNQLADGKAFPEHMFFTKGGKEMTPQQMWQSVFNHTGLHVAHNRYKGIGIPGCQPFGPHAYRDIRATDILLHPCETDAYLEAANALQTSPAMIVGHYGRVRSEVRNAVSDKRFMEVAKEAAAAAKRAA